ncbi:MAG: CDP-alcohol phosphatidyltransferase family protein [Balneolaceae bacterium]|nr:MAG: CDP-alcohol phosphatidyltransferase family protein [Balneolaceae bacterium]
MIMKLKDASLNIPNILSLSRLLGVPLLFVFINFENQAWFILWFIYLGLTDYFDGLLARRWNQVSEFGSMLDAVADVAYYISAAFFLFYLFPEYLQPNYVYLLAMFIIFGASVFVSHLKLGRILFLHTHLSRLCGVLVFFGVLASFFFDTTFLIRSIIFIYSMAFIEVITIFLLYGNVDPDTRSILHLRGEKRNKK